MGAALILDDTCGAEEVATASRTGLGAEFSRAAVADQHNGRVALMLLRSVAPVHQAPLKVLHDVRHELSPSQARRLAEMLILAADRAEARRHG